MKEESCCHQAVRYTGDSKWKCLDCGQITLESQIKPKWIYTEWKLFEKEYDQKVADDDAQFIVNKLTKHFKLGKIEVFFRGNSGNGTAFVYDYRPKIRLSHNPSIGTIAHEVTHFLAQKRWGRLIRHNSKKWITQLKRVVNYGNKKSWWQAELERKKVPKPSEPKPTKEELRAQRIKKLEQFLKKYQSRLKLYTTKIKKIQRRLGILKRMQEKEVKCPQLEVPDK